MDDYRDRDNGSIDVVVNGVNKVFAGKVIGWGHLYT